MKNDLLHYVPYPISVSSIELEDPADSTADSELMYDPGLIGEPDVILLPLLLNEAIFPK